VTTTPPNRSRQDRHSRPGPALASEPRPVSSALVAAQIPHKDEPGSSHRGATSAVRTRRPYRRSCAEARGADHPVRRDAPHGRVGGAPQPVSSGAILEHIRQVPLFSTGIITRLPQLWIGPVGGNGESGRADRCFPNPMGEPARPGQRDHCALAVSECGDPGRRPLTGYVTALLYPGPQFDFGGCAGPQSPKSTRLTFEVDVV